MFGQSGVICCTCLKMACNSKADHFRVKAKGIETGARVLVEHIWCTFDLVVFNVIWGSFGAPVSKWTVSLKWLTVKQNGLNLEHSRTSYLVVFKVIWGHPIHLLQTWYDGIFT